MATIQNDRDVLLQGAAVRDIDPTAGKALSLYCDTPVFHVSAAGVPSPVAITVTAQLINISGPITWTVVGATVVPSGGVNATLSYVSMLSSSATVTASITYKGQIYSASVKISKVIDGAPGAPGDDGSDGQRGTVNLIAPGSSWSDSVANGAISSEGYGSPQRGDIVTISNGSSFAETRVRTSSSTWIVVTAYINGNLVVAGTLVAEAIDTGTLTGQTYRTAVSGQRVTINVGNNNRIVCWDSSGNIAASIGNEGSGRSGYFEGVGGSGAVVGIKSTTQTALSIQSGSGLGLSVDGGTSLKNTTSYTFYPATNNAYSCGTSANAWSDIYSMNALTVTSDARAKTDIEDLPAGLQTILALRPRRYRLKAREQYQELIFDPEGPPLPGESLQIWETRTRPGARWHFGLIAQEVEQVIGLDNAVVCLDNKDDPESMRSLRYEELLPVVICAVQELNKILQVRDNEIAVLSERVATLESAS